MTTRVWAQVLGGLTVAVLSAGSWLAWMGWDDEYQIDPRTQVASGPYEAWQVVGCGGSSRPAHRRTAVASPVVRRLAGDDSGVHRRLGRHRGPVRRDRNVRSRHDPAVVGPGGGDDGRLDDCLGLRRLRAPKPGREFCPISNVEVVSCQCEVGKLRCRAGDGSVRAVSWPGRVDDSVVRGEATVDSEGART